MGREDLRNLNGTAASGNADTKDADKTLAASRHLNYKPVTRQALDVRGVGRGAPQTVASC
jgi:hypothetical protein